MIYSGREKALPQIPRWVRSYSQNRSGALRTLVVVLFVAQSYTVVGLAAYWARQTYRGGHTAGLLLCLTAILISTAAVVWLCVPRWGGAWLGRYTRLRGEVTLPAGIEGPAGVSWQPWWGSCWFALWPKDCSRCSR